MREIVVGLITLTLLGLIGCGVSVVEQGAGSGNQAVDSRPVGVSSTLKVHFLDVGHGSATLITSPSGERVLVDGGPSGSRLLERLQTIGAGNLDLVIATHSDRDHVKGLITAMDQFEIGSVYLSAHDESSASWNSFLHAVEQSDATAEYPTAGDAIQLGGGVVLHFLNPTSSLGASAHEDSTVLALVCGSVGFLLTSDIDVPGLHQIVESRNDLQFDVISVPGHGGRTDFDPSAIGITDVKYAIVSAGHLNSYGFPTESVVDKLVDQGMEVLITDLEKGKDDTLLVSTDCTSISVER